MMWTSVAIILSKNIKTWKATDVHIMSEYGTYFALHAHNIANYYTASTWKLCALKGYKKNIDRFLKIFKKMKIEY